MSELNKRESFSKYDSLPTEELQELLRKHANGELETEPDTDELYYIMEVLAQRREKLDPQAFRSDVEALSYFRKHYIPKEKESGRSKAIGFPNRILKTVAAVLVAMLILTVGTSITAEALQIDIWGKFATWTKEIFHFSDVGDPTQATTPVKENNLELESLRKALSQYNISQDIVPTWLPEGYVFNDINALRSPREISISAKYERKNEELIISIRQTIGIEPEQIEKSENLVEIYSVNGVDYYIFSNNRQLQAVWITGELECIVGGKMTLEEIKAMIDSI